jgi:hypothetical protein
MKYAIGNFVVIGADPLGMYAQWRVDEERAEETSE